VDAFTGRAFRGNPAAVCLLESPGDAEWMRLVAREMAVSETAFVVRRDDGFSLRWMTPVTEVDLCGHATLAAAHVLWETGRLGPGEEARFLTRSGLLSARQADGPGWIALDFPALAFEPGPVPPEVLKALGVEARLTGTSGPRWLVEVATEAEVRNLRPDFARLRAVPGRAVIVTAAASPGGDCDVVSRYFAPWVGVDEDPVTGSAHCCLAPLWSARLGKRELVAEQASPRGGRLHLAIAGDRVRVAGQAVTVVAGHLLA
jgi:PhzF family phenazine biosynthesis protein